MLRETIPSRYLLPGTRETPVRAYPSCCLTRGQLFQHCYRTVATPTNMLVYVVIPAFQALTVRLDEHCNPDVPEKYGTPLTLDDLQEYVSESFATVLPRYGRMVACVAVQGLLVEALYTFSGSVRSGRVPRLPAAENAVVHGWLTYPRIHAHYLDELMRKLHAPSCIMWLAGPPTPQDLLEVWDTRLPLVNAFDDALKRNAITTCASTIVTVAQIYLPGGDGRPRGSRRRRNRHTRALLEVASRSLTLACQCFGAAAGNTIDGGRGEYWGELLGLFLGSAVVDCAVRVVVINQTCRKKNI